MYEMNVFLHEGINAFHVLVNVRYQCSTTPHLWHGLTVTGRNISRNTVNSQNVCIRVVYVDTIGLITFPVFHA